MQKSWQGSSKIAKNNLQRSVKILKDLVKILVRIVEILAL